MLGRKQSLRPEPVMTDYGPDEALNENVDIEWVHLNTVTHNLNLSSLN